MKPRSVVLLISFFLLLAGGLMAGPMSSAALLKKSKTQDDVAAIKTLRAVLGRKPGHLEANYRLGFLYQKMNRRGPAEKHYLAVLKRRSCHVRALNNLGGVLLDSNRSAEAEARYRRAIQCNPEFFPAHYNLANILKDRGDFSAAVVHYRHAIRRRPDHGRSHHNLGIVYHHLATGGGPESGKLAGLSLSHLKRSIEIAPRDSLSRFNYARILAAGGHRDLALKELKIAERFARKNPGLGRKIRTEYRRLKYEPKVARR